MVRAGPHYGRELRPMAGSADEVRLSRSQLVLAFDATGGLTSMACLQRMRDEQMARLLASSDLSIGEPAHAIGWTDPNYASRCFRARYCISPTEFRRQQSTNQPI